MHTPIIPKPIMTPSIRPKRMKTLIQMAALPMPTIRIDTPMRPITNRTRPECHVCGVNTQHRNAIPTTPAPLTRTRRRASGNLAAAAVRPVSYQVDILALAFGFGGRRGGESAVEGAGDDGEECLVG